MPGTLMRVTVRSGASVTIMRSRQGRSHGDGDHGDGANAGAVNGWICHCISWRLCRLRSQ